MKHLQKTLMYLVIATAVAFTSCSTDGEDGMDGIQGIAGQDGEDGQDGMDGQDGQDGNANVTGVTVDPFPTWESGSYLGALANIVEIDEPLLTAQVTDDALVLVYFQLFGTNIWHPMTLNFPLSSGEDQVITFTYEPELITIYSLQSSGPLDAGISKLRYFIIPTSDAAGRSMSSREATLGELSRNGVDVTNYYEVVNYFNLD